MCSEDLSLADGIRYGGKQRLVGDEIMFNCKNFYSLPSVKYLLDI